MNRNWSWKDIYPEIFSRSNWSVYSVLSAGTTQGTTNFCQTLFWDVLFVCIVTFQLLIANCNVNFFQYCSALTHNTLIKKIILIGYCAGVSTVPHATRTWVWQAVSEDPIIGWVCQTRFSSFKMHCSQAVIHVLHCHIYCLHCHSVLMWGASKQMMLPHLIWALILYTEPSFCHIS